MSTSADPVRRFSPCCISNLSICASPVAATCKGPLALMVPLGSVAISVTWMFRVGSAIGPSLEWMFSATSTFFSRFTRPVMPSILVGERLRGTVISVKLVASFTRGSRCLRSFGSLERSIAGKDKASIVMKPPASRISLTGLADWPNFSQGTIDASSGREICEVLRFCRVIEEFLRQSST